MPTSPEKRESLLWRDQYDRTAHASVSLYLNPSHSSHSLRFQPRATRPPLRSSFSFSILWLSPLSGPQLSHTPSSRLFPSPHDLHQVEENVVCQTVGERGVDLSRFSQQRTVCGRIPSSLWVLLTPRCSDFCFVPISVPSLRFDSFLHAWIIASSRTSQERATTRSRNHSIKPNPSIRLPFAILILEIRHWFILPPPLLLPLLLLLLLLLLLSIPYLLYQNRSAKLADWLTGLNFGFASLFVLGLQLYFLDHGSWLKVFVFMS